MHALIKCRILRHILWVFTVCRSSPVGISSIQRVKSPELNSLNNSCLSALVSSDIAKILLAGPGANQKKLFANERFCCIIWKKGSFRNRENLQNLKTAASFYVNVHENFMESATTLLPPSTSFTVVILQR